jgi:hypothetical protein
MNQTPKRGRGDRILPAITTHQTKQMCAALAGGSRLETAAAMVGIARSTLFLWLRVGRAYLEAEAAGGRRNPRHELQGAFVSEVERALARVEVGLTAQIATASKSDWKAAAWLLERRFPEGWQAKRDIEKPTTEIVVDIGPEGADE